MAIGDVDVDRESRYDTLDFPGNCGKVGCLETREARILGDSSALHSLKEVAARSLSYFQPRSSGPIIGMTKCTRYVEEACGEVTIKPGGEIVISGSIKFREPEKKDETPPKPTPAKPSLSGNTNPS